MLDEFLASRYDFETQAQEDKYGRHLVGRRKEDGLPVTMTVLDPGLKVQVGDLHAVAVASRRLAEAGQPVPLLTLEVGRTEGGNLYLVCEASPVESLRTLLRTRGPLSPAESLTVAWRIALALRDAAALGIRHLDLSSNTVFVSLSPSPVVRVARFGWSHLLPGYNPARKNEPFHGLPEYLAPEVCAGRAGDEVADLYSLGILMYEMVAGKPPFVSASPSTTIKRQVYERPLPLHLVRPGMGQIDAYERLVSLLLAKDPKTRAQSAQAVLDQIAALKAEAHADADLSAVAPREGPVTILSSLEAEATTETAPVDAQPAQSRETMVFTGLAEAIEQARAMTAAAAAPATSQAGEGRPTEAFDPSLIATAVETSRVATAPEDEATRVVNISEEPREEPVAKVPEATEATAPGAPVAEAPASTEGPIADEWFRKTAEVEPEAAVPPSDVEAAKESRMFWVIAAAVVILLVLAAVVWFESRTAESPEEVPTAGEVAPAPSASAPSPVAPAPRVEAPPPAPAPQVEAPPPAPAPRVEAPPPAPETRSPSPPTPEPQSPKSATSEPVRTGVPGAPRVAPVPPPAPAPEPAPTPAPRAPKKTPVAAKAPTPAPAAPAPSAEEREARAKALVLAGQQAMKDGRYQEAVRKFEEATRIDPGNALAPKLLERARAKAAEEAP